MNRYYVCWANTILRLFICGLAIITGYIGINDPRSLFYLLASHDQGFILLRMLVLFSVIGALDVVVNDFLPRQFRVGATEKLRHFGFACLAFCYVASIFVAHETVRSPGLTAYYFWNALCIVAIALVDASQRAKGPIQLFNAHHA